MSTWTEPEREIPVIYEVDVAVAGGGVSGVNAALAAARGGADTLLIERQNVLGGNYGPGWRPPGGRREAIKKPREEPTGFIGLTEEILKRLEVFGMGKTQPTVYGAKNWMTESVATEYILLKILEESGVKLMLNTFVSDPILENTSIRGMLVENKSGRGAIKAKVLIDATGEADLARRAGAPIIYPDASYHEMDSHSPTGVGGQYAILGIDWDRYGTYLESEPEEPEDPNPIKVPIPKWQVDCIAFGMTGRKPPLEPGIDAGDGLHISELEAAFHTSVFEKVQRWKKELPGFEHAELLAMTPFLGARGGPCIEGEHVVTMDDVLAGRQFTDNLYVFLFRPPRPEGTRPPSKWTELPYRCMLPKDFDGLLCTGRSASSVPDTLLRNRNMIGMMGQAAGTAAAMASAQGIAPRNLDVQPLQRALMKAGFYLGSDKRLKELGLLGP